MADAKGGKLLEAITKALPRASTQALDISFNELLDMYKNKELNIAPDFQRLFRWSPGQRSRFIESLLLEMPVWPAPGSEDTELGVLMGPEVRHGEAEVYARVQA
jgi:hypothetical protein